MGRLYLASAALTRVVLQLRGFGCVYFDLFLKCNDTSAPKRVDAPLAFLRFAEGGGDAILRVSLSLWARRSVNFQK